MANTTASAIANVICLNEAQGRCVSGFLHEDMAPGTVVVYDSATHHWIKADSDTSGHSLRTIGVVGYRRRIRASSGAVVGIDDNWDISEAEDKIAPVWTDGFVVAKMDDQQATCEVLTHFKVSATGGTLTIQTTTGATSGTAIIAVSVATLAATSITADTFGIFAIGKYFGQVWGGQNIA